MAQTLVDSLAQCNVEDAAIVSFENQGLKLDNAAAAADIVRAIETCTGMEVLNLAGNTLGVEAAQEIANALQSRPTLKYALWKDMYTGRLRSEIPPSLRALSGAMLTAGTQLVELDLSDNAFGPDGAEAIRGLLTSPVAYTIRTLKFQNNGLGGGGVIIAECLTANHARAKREGKSLDLRTFIAGRNRLENPGATALAKAFSLLGTLEQIEVIQNGIQYEGISAIADCIKHSPNLRILNLNDNIMTPRGAIAIAKALPSATKLEVLNMGDCLVKSAGAKAVAENISGLTSLKELILSFNEIRADGGSAVGAACATLPSLTTLDLDGNQFGEEGKKQVSDSLGSAVGLLQPGLSEDVGVPSDEEDEQEEEKKETESSAAAPAGSPFVFGSPAPKLVGSEPNRSFGFGATSTGFSFSSLAGTNIFANKGESDFKFKGAGATLFSKPAETGGDDNPEQEAEVQFEPLVQLTKVEMKSGEEDDEEIFRHRAKLFRFDGGANMWKERGVGDIRILQDRFTKKSRLLMRRDIILKICCNHLITKRMEMLPNAGSDKSLVWFTSSDYADGEPKPEKLAVRFKTPEICKAFLAGFNAARNEMPEPGSTPEKRPVAAVPSFASLAAGGEKAAFAAAPTAVVTPVKESGAREEAEETYEPDVTFKPLVKLDKVEITSGTEEEESKFTHRCKLYRFDKDSSQWKERGLGDISVMWDRQKGKARILMRREQVLKICCNHAITPEMQLEFKQDNDKFLVWHTFADFTEEEPRFEQLAARFKTAEAASNFKEAFEECKANLGKVDLSEDPEAEEAREVIESVKISDGGSAGGMANFIAAQKEKWNCDTCGLHNEKGAACCIACQTPNPAAPAAAVVVTEEKQASPAAPTFSFGCAPGTTGLSTFSFGNKPAAAGTETFSFGNASLNGAQPAFSFGNATTNPPFQFSAAPVLTTPEKETAAPKPSPFAGFEFGPKTTSTVTAVESVNWDQFVASPTESDLKKIVDTQAVLNAIETGNASKVAAFIGRLSKLVSNETSDTCQKLVTALLASSYGSCNPTHLTNELLVTLDFIKSEDKDFKPESDPDAMLQLLSHTATEPFFPATSRKIVGAFVKKQANRLTNSAGIIERFDI